MKSGYLGIGPDCNGAKQMELDRSMLSQTERDGYTRIRFYRFVPPAVSLGYNQKREDIDLDLCTRQGVEVVRRPTGGRAVLHKGDLVYSISVAVSGMHESESLHREVYNLVSLSLIEGLQSLGIPAAGSTSSALPLSSSRVMPKLCFSSTTRHEVQLNGKKLVGSAQRKGKNAVLQHGSILVTEEYLEIAQLLAGLDSNKRDAVKMALKNRTICLREAGFDRTIENLIEALKVSFLKNFR